jgi:hypothetical protein
MAVDLECCGQALHTLQHEHEKYPNKYASVH